ncbi:cellulose binding domain-containing protein [Glycomyces sp. TRM65418]|uniref:glycoside hydrolase family 48 protein n=1 Tax=Glycomyces sp. TRM65418 TaxID=2867006 RepID=UPI001CE5EB28|nr:glycoside hydrolase family 48 protein [Glycomyces sp. TRM65418]MCC3764625.1 cellulose binding domain-containing protein [Glycomyces sp. TRM65418]QZD54289.1 cellulose binding domain-containing protein [Glycomyces sp. TRM65418]
MELDNLAPPRPRRRWRRAAAVTLPVALVGTLAAVAAPQAFAAQYCGGVQYNVISTWGGGFQANVVITAGDAGLNGWDLEWDFPSGTQVTNAWNVDWSQSGSHFTGSDVGWNGSIASGQSREVFGFIGSGSATAPTGVKVNGESCDGSTTDPELTVSRSNVVVEAGATASVDVGFSAATDSAATVTTARTSGSSAISVSAGGSLSFAAGDSAPKPVTFSASADAAPGDSATFTVSSPGYESLQVVVTIADLGEVTQNEERFLEMYDQLTGPDSPYLHETGVPYHSVEELIVEAPDYGHQTTSEALSYLMWLEAAYGQVTGDWSGYNESWDITEQYAIPDLNPTSYDPNSPASYAPESGDVTDYPTQLDFDASVGSDPIGAELRNTYGSNQIYGMHWLLDVDNAYGFGECGDGTTEPAYMNTFQRGSQESTWETIGHPSCETFDFGGPNGFLDLFVGDSQYSRQERYTAAPDADARAIQLAWTAQQWAAEQGQESAVSESVDRASKMGDFLRYAFADKYFKQIAGDCIGIDNCPDGNGKNSFHYLLSWYYSWGAGMNGDWSFRIGGSGVHQGYQNPMAAYALSEGGLEPDSPTAASDWAKSLDAQLDFLEWLQVPAGSPGAGAIAGGATNNWGGHYGNPTTSAEHAGLYYDEQPVWHDPPSNRWFGFQAWGMDRVAQYCQVTGDARACEILDDWVAWALSESEISATDYSIPGDLEWNGEPGAGLSASVTSMSKDPGVAGAFAKILSYHAAATGDTASQTAASNLLDALWAVNDGIGVTQTEARADYCRFGDEVYIPEGWTGTMPNGDVLENGVTFIETRSFMRDFEGWDQVQAYIDGGCTGPAPEFDYHRYWHQVEVATAFQTYALLFE